MEYNFIRFADASPVLDFYTPVIIANNDFLENRPETARNFIQATAQGYNFAMTNPREAAEILLDAVPELSPELIFASVEFLSDKFAPPGARWGVFDERRWTAFYDWMYEQGIISVSLGNKGFTNAFL